MREERLETIRTVRHVRLRAYVLCEDNYVSDTRRRTTVFQMDGEYREASVETTRTRPAEWEDAAATAETSAPAGALTDIRPPDDQGDRS